MPQNIETVDAYIANAPKDRRDDLNKLRTLLVQEVPNAKELIKYKMPYYSNQKDSERFSTS